MGLPRQEYWSGLPFPSLGALPDPGIEPILSVIYYIQFEAMEISESRLNVKSKLQYEANSFALQFCFGLT